MKNDLGRAIFFLLSFLPLAAFGDPLATYELQASNQNPYLKEAVEVTITTRQTDHTHVMFFFVKPKKSDAYKAIFLNKEIQDKGYHDSSAVFRFVIFPLQPKKALEVKFDFTVKTASDDAVAKAYVEDHDDSVGIDLQATPIAINPLVLEVKPLQKPVSLVGDFTLTPAIDTQTINQYQSVNLRYKLQGKGYFEHLPFFDSIEGASVFKDVITLKNRLTPKGYEIEREYLYAISAKKSFTIPHIKIEAFNPHTQKYYTLSAPSFTVDVQPIDTSKLLDNEEVPKNEPLVRIETLQTLFGYALVFFLGYYSAKLRADKEPRPKRIALGEKLQNAKTPKELMLLLLSDYQDHPKTKEFVDTLEVMIHDKTTKNFDTLKKKVLKSLAPQQEEIVKKRRFDVAASVVVKTGEIVRKIWRLRPRKRESR